MVIHRMSGAKDVEGLSNKADDEENFLRETDHCTRCPMLHVN